MIEKDDVIAGRYVVSRHLGRGGMQDVYLATDTLLNIDVALKTPQSALQAQQFQASAVIAAKINHHNVAKTLDYIRDGEKEYLIEEYVQGETLADKLKRYPFFDPYLAAHVFHLLVNGIRASHLAGVIHRDLKPSNVMVSEGVNVTDLKITDFGIATLAAQVFDKAEADGELTNSTSGTVKGALPFMAYEMMFRQPGVKPGPAADIWSLGAMMFLLLTGEYPFGLYLEAVVNVKTGNRVPWPAFMTAKPQFSSLAKSLQLMVDQCLNYDPAQRPSADQLAQQCQDLCYMNARRECGQVTTIIQNGYSGFINNNGDDAFFHMDSVYGQNMPDFADNAWVCYSRFPGTPYHRAHPVIVLKPNPR